MTTAFLLHRTRSSIQKVVQYSQDYPFAYHNLVVCLALMRIQPGSNIFREFNESKSSHDGNESAQTSTDRRDGLDSGTSEVSSATRGRSSAPGLQ